MIDLLALMFYLFRFYTKVKPFLIKQLLIHNVHTDSKAYKKYWVFLVFLGLMVTIPACSTEHNPSTTPNATNDTATTTVVEPKPVPRTMAQRQQDAQTWVLDSIGQSIAQTFLNMGLTDIHSLDSSIVVNLKYATEDNFMGQNMYGNLQQAYLQPAAASKLLKATQQLTALKPGYRLIIYDAARPHRIQLKMWDKVKSTPQQMYVADPVTGSMHSYGCSVDLSIVDVDGVPLDMGTPYDSFTPEAQPRNEATYLKNGKLTPQQIENRKLLRKIMTDAGFIYLRHEWWHFDAFTHAYIYAHFKRIP